MRGTLFVLLLLAGPALGQPPKPDPVPKHSPVASVTVPPGPLYAGDLIVLDGSQSIGDSIDWELISPPDITTYVPDSNGKTLTFANAKAGTYVFRIEADSVIDGKIVKSKKRVTLATIDRPAPVPVPPAPPVPGPPTPIAFTKPAHVTLVVDSNSASQALADLIGSQTIAASALSLGAIWHVLDVNDVKEYTRRGLAKAVAAGGGPPYVVVQGSPAIPGGSSPIIAQAKAAVDEVSMVAYLKSVVGGN